MTMQARYVIQPRLVMKDSGDRMRMRCYPFLGWLALAALLQPGAAEDSSVEFSAAKRVINEELKSRKSLDRITALDRLQNYPTVEAAKLVLDRGLKDKSQEVREAAALTLMNYKDNQQVCEYLLKTLVKESHRKDAKGAAYPILMTLLASDVPEVQAELSKQLEKLAGTKDGLAAVISLADDLGTQGDEAALAALSKLAKTKACAKNFGLRRSLVQALTRTPLREAIDALVDILSNDQGEVRADIVQFLTLATGQAHGADAQAWSKWWLANKETFKFGPRVERMDARQLAAAGMPSYYGLPLYAQRMVFILDTSGSMAGPRLAAAKRELVTAIGNLRPNVSFTVVVFNSTVTVWNKQLVPATPVAKKNAAEFVMVQTPSAMTASYDALEAAFTFDAEAIYFLTDGAPHGGKVNNPVDIVNVITKGNRLRRLSIYSIGIGVGPEGGYFDVFLKTLADQNFGTYRRVDQ